MIYTVNQSFKESVYIGHLFIKFTSMKRQKPVYLPFIEDTQHIFSTYDLGCSAGLIGVGYELLRIEKVKGESKALFIFQRSDELEESARQYWKDDLGVSALSYFNALKTLKNQLYSS